MPYINDVDKQEIIDAIERLDIEEAIKEAREMGIKIHEKKRGYHTIIEDGKIVPLDVKKHLKLP